MSRTREEVENFAVETVVRLDQLVRDLVQALEYDQLVEFIHMLDDEVADSVFTDKLHNRVVQIRNEME